MLFGGREVWPVLDGGPTAQDECQAGFGRSLSSALGGKIALPELSQHHLPSAMMKQPSE